MITLEDLKNELKEKELLKKQTETIYTQLIGQIQLLNSLIERSTVTEK